MALWATCLFAALLAFLVASPAHAQDVGPTGSYQTSYPIKTPSYHGLEPDLGLTYDSSTGNGLVGVGWELAGFSYIQRASPGKGAPNYDESDVFFLDGMELIPCEEGMQSPSCKYPVDNPGYKAYATKTESYRRIAFDPGGGAYGGLWYVWNKDGTKTTYGANDTFLNASQTEWRAFNWSIISVEEPAGDSPNSWRNIVEYSYGHASNEKYGVQEQYPMFIDYKGAHTSIRFSYEERPDPITTATGLSEFSTVRYRLKTIDVTVGGQRARAYELRYDNRDSSTGRSLLSEVQEYGRDTEICYSTTLGCGAYDPWWKATFTKRGKTLSPVTFRAQDGGVVGEWEHQSASDPGWGPQDTVPMQPMFTQDSLLSSTDDKVYHTGDVNGDGKSDWIRLELKETRDGWKMTVTTIFASLHLCCGASTSLPWPYTKERDQTKDIARTRYFIADFNGDGRDDIMFLIPNIDPNDWSIAHERLLVAFSKGRKFAYGPPVSGSEPAPDPVATPWESNESDLQQINCQPGDVNGDGKSDFMCSFDRKDEQHEGWDHFIGTALSLGDGRFDIRTSSAGLGSSEYGNPQLAVGDTNGDGMSDVMLLDLCQCPEDTPDDKLYYDLVTGVSDGSGYYHFRRQATDWVPFKFRDVFLLYALFAADINGDGKSDYVTWHYDDRGHPWYWFRIAMTQPSTQFALREWPLPSSLTLPKHLLQQAAGSWTFGDANGDGKDDMLAEVPVDPHPATSCSKQYDSVHPVVARILSNGDGTFHFPERWDDCEDPNLEELDFDWGKRLYHPHPTVAADTNGDGRADFLSAFQTKDPFGPSEVTLHDTVSPNTGVDPDRWLPADINGDGRRDLVYVDQRTPIPPEGPNPSPIEQEHEQQIYVLLGQADGGYSQVISPVHTTLVNRAVARNWRVMDVDGDGDDELVYVRSEGDLLDDAYELWGDVYFYKGDGEWDEQSRRATLSEDPIEVMQWRPMDVDGDGRADLVEVEPDGTSGVMVRTMLSRFDGPGDGSWIYVQHPKEGGQFGGQDTLNWRPADVNGDGNVDLLHIYYLPDSDTLQSRTCVFVFLSDGAGDWIGRPSEQTPDSSCFTNREFQDQFPDTLNWKLGDVNADGKTDLLRVRQKPWSAVRVNTLLSTGSGIAWISKSKVVEGSGLGSTVDTKDWRVADVNNDSRADLIRPLDEPLNEFVVSTVVSTGDDSWESKKPYFGSWGPDPVDVDSIYAIRWNLADVNGDDKDDLTRVDERVVSGSTNGTAVSSLLSSAPQDLMVESSNGMGGTTTVDYRPSSSWPVGDRERGCHLPVGMVLQTATSVSTQEGDSGASDKLNHSYSCPRWSYEERSFLGWEDVSSGHPSTVNSPPSVTRTHYEVSDQCGAQPATSQFEDSDGNILTRTETAYVDSGKVGDAPYHCLPYSRVDYQCDAGTHAVDDSVCAAKRTEFTYDYFGNNYVRYECSYDEFGDDIEPHDCWEPSAEEGRTIWTQYYPNKGLYIVGLPSRERVFDGLGNWDTVSSDTRYCYDYDEPQSCEAPPSRGLLTATKAWDDQSQRYLTTTYEYDDYGNQTSVEDANGHCCTTIVYDPTYHLFPVTITNALGHTTTLVWDTVIGQLKGVTDANGTHTYFNYDELGRPTQTCYPDGGVRQLSYPDWGNPEKQRVREFVVEERVPWCEELDENNLQGLWTETYLDGLGRAYRVEKEGDTPDVSFAQDTLYSGSTSQVYKQSHWYEKHKTNPEEPEKYYEQFSYDEAGRLVEQRHPDDSILRWEYGEDGTRTWVTSHDELMNQKTVYTDAFGRTVQVREVNRNDSKDPNYDTFYEYNVLDNPTKVTDDKGNSTTMSWDSLGRQMSVDDPDMGYWTYNYDDVGNLTRQTDARGVTTEFTYDELDRLKSKQWNPPHGKITRWHYDEPTQDYSVGRLTSISDPTGSGCPDRRSERLNYDEMGRVNISVKCVHDVAHGIGTGYNLLGQQSWISYPEGEGSEVVNYDYDAAGRLRSMPGFVDSLSYDAAGQLTEAKLANGTEESFHYNPKRDWLEDASVRRGGETLYQAGYKYEVNGLIKSTSSTTNDEMDLSYTYDDLGRLTKVRTDPDRKVKQSFRYNSIGNMTYNSTLGKYKYPASGPNGCGTDKPCARPHAVRQAGSHEYEYDANGNMTSRDGRRIRWNEDNHPERIEYKKGKRERYLYDASGERVLKEPIDRPDKATYYNGPLLSFTFSKGLTKQYYAGSTLLASKSSDETHWFHQDHLGSTRLETDQAGKVIRSCDYTPFGEAACDPTAPIAERDMGFGGHETDGKTGLSYMGARYYDPQLARFISADAIVPDPVDPQALNRYSYAYNNPLSFADPTGHEPECDTLCISADWPPVSSNPSNPEMARSFLSDYFTPAEFPTLTRNSAPAPLPEWVRRGNPCPRCHGYDPEAFGPREPITRTQMRYLWAASIGAPVMLAAAPELLGGASLAMTRAYLATPAFWDFMSAAGLASIGVNVSSPATSVATSKTVWQSLGSTLNPYARGRVIEKLLGGNLPSNYPVIDKAEQVVSSGVAATTITSIKSIDLGARSYQSGGAVLSRLTQYINSLAGFGGRTSSWAGVSVTVGPNTQRVLEVAIPATNLTQAQANQLLQVEEYARKRGVNIIWRRIQ